MTTYLKKLGNVEEFHSIRGSEKVRNCRKNNPSEKSVYHWCL